MLFLSNTSLTGTLPPEWGRGLITEMCVNNDSSVLRCSADEASHLNSNQLSGTLPPEWSDIPVDGLCVSPFICAEVFRYSDGASYLHENQLSGTLPPEWSNSSVGSLYVPLLIGGDYSTILTRLHVQVVAQK